MPVDQLSDACGNQAFILPSHDTHQTSAPNSLKPSSSPYSQRRFCFDRIHPADTASTPPAEASSVSSATPSVWKEDSFVLVRSGVRLARGGRGIAGGEHQVEKTARDETSPVALRHETPEAQCFLLAEREGEASAISSRHLMRPPLRWPCRGLRSTWGAHQKRRERNQQQRTAWALLRFFLFSHFILFFF